MGYFELEGLPENYRHLTCGVDDDPDTLPDERADERAMRALEALLREQFRPRIKRVAGIENCLSTRTHGVKTSSWTVTPDRSEWSSGPASPATASSWGR